LFIAIVSTIFVDFNATETTEESMSEEDIEIAFE